MEYVTIEYDKPHSIVSVSIDARQQLYIRKTQGVTYGELWFMVSCEGVVFVHSCLGPTDELEWAAKLACLAPIPASYKVSR